MADAPKILGVECTVVTTDERRCTARFGLLETGFAYVPNVAGEAFGAFGSVPWWIGTPETAACPRSHSNGCEPTISKAIAAIERA